MRERLPELGGLRVTSHPNMSKMCRDGVTAGTACLPGARLRLSKKDDSRSWEEQTLWTPKMSQ